MSESMTKLTEQERQERYDTLAKIYLRQRARDLRLDLSRGKPSMDQLDWVAERFYEHPLMSYLSEDGIDTRNYGTPEGLPEARRLMAKLAGTSYEKMIVAGASSLELMYTSFMRMMMFPLPGQTRAWKDLEKVKVLCPAPGYDRHFQMADALGCELVTVPMRHDGPDMDVVEALLAEDPAIKAMWIVPKYANPTGATCSQRVLQRMASMEAPEDFVIFCDNAYGMHPVLDSDAPELPDLLSLCEGAGRPNRALLFCSTSKITFASAGIAGIAMNPELRQWWLKHHAFNSIGPDKVNQLHHVQVIRAVGGLTALMRRHQQLLAPRFSLVLDVLDERLGDLGFAHWTQGEGGYFISLDVMPGTAKRTVSLAAEAGVKLTPAGATFPYGIDPEDQNIRIAPSYPDYDELRPAMEVLCLAATLAALEKLGISRGVDGLL